MIANIVIIDDDQSILDALQALLEIDGHQVTSFKDALSVFDQLPRLKPDIIFLDLLLSGADGRDIAKRIKAMPEMRNTPVILMSADAQIQEKSQEATANNYLKKPFDIDELEKLVGFYTAKVTDVKR